MKSGEKKPDNNDKLKKTSVQWLKSAGYLDTEDQKSINYIYVPPKGDQKNKISGDAGHFIRSGIENLASKIIAKNIVKKYKKWQEKNPIQYQSLLWTRQQILKKAKKLAQIKDKEIVEKPKVYTKVRE